MEISWDLESLLDKDYFNFIEFLKTCPYNNLDYYSDLVSVFLLHTNSSLKTFKTLEPNQLNLLYIKHIYDIVLSNLTSLNSYTRSLTLNYNEYSCTTSKYIYENLGIREMMGEFPLYLNPDSSIKPNKVLEDESEIVFLGNTDMIFNLVGLEKLNSHPLVFIVDSFGSLNNKEGKYSNIELNLLSLLNGSFQFSDEYVLKEFIELNNFKKSIGLSDFYSSDYSGYADFNKLQLFVNVLSSLSFNLDFDYITLKLDYDKVIKTFTQFGVKSKYNNNDELRLKEFLSVLITWNHVLFRHFKKVDFLIFSKSNVNDLDAFCKSNSINASVIQSSK